MCSFCIFTGLSLRLSIAAGISLHGAVIVVALASGLDVACLLYVHSTFV